MGPRTRSCSQQNTVGEAPPTDEQEERNVQAALAQTAIDEDARTVARDTLKRRAQLHNLRIVEKGGDGHCLQYSVQDQLRQQGIDGQTTQILRPAMAAFIGDKARYFKQFLTDEEREQSRGEGSSPTYGTRMAMRGVGGVIWKFLLCLACFNALFNTSPLAKGMHTRGVSFRLKPDTSNSHEFELHRPSNKGTKLLLKVLKAIIIISQHNTSLHGW